MIRTQFTFGAINREDEFRAHESWAPVLRNWRKGKHDKDLFEPPGASLQLRKRSQLRLLCLVSSRPKVKYMSMM